MELPVCREDQRVGSLRLREQGGWAELVMTCQPDSTGLFRGCLACDGGELPLGVLSPEGGCLRAARRVPLSELRALGTARRGFCRLSYPFGGENWQPVTNGFFRRCFRGTLEKTEGALWREDQERRWLAVPWNCGRPFPLTELLCFVQVREIQGRPYALLSFDSDEWPQMP